jgi:protein involved in polysaccharide export with SLBB domain
MMKAALATIVLLLLSIAALAQTANTRTYRIKPDDILRIQVYGEAQVNAEIPVGQDGNISAPFVGTIRAEGKTTSELEADLTEAYKQRLRLRDPKVSVTFARYKPIRASIGGGVARPGQYELRGGDTILTLVSLGGDPVEGIADLHRASLHRKNTQEKIPIDLYSMLRKGDLSQDYEIEDGDVLEVPVDVSRNSIKVLGFVQRPNQYTFREPMTLADAISQAGGEISGRSMMSQIRVTREVPGAPGTFMQIKTNFVRYTNEGDASQNIELRPGDLIYVPATKWSTADINTAANIVNSLFFIQNILRGGLRIFR